MNTYVYLQLISFLYLVIVDRCIPFHTNIVMKRCLFSFRYISFRLLYKYLTFNESQSQSNCHPVLTPILCKKLLRKMHTKTDGTRFLALHKTPSAMTTSFRVHSAKAGWQLNGCGHMPSASKSKSSQETKAS